MLACKVNLKQRVSQIKLPFEGYCAKRGDHSYSIATSSSSAPLELVRCVFPVEPQSPNGKNINVHKKCGFRRFQKEHQKVRKTALFAHFLRKKCGFPHFLVLFLESAETTLFVQINVFAVWALRLDRNLQLVC